MMILLMLLIKCLMLSPPGEHMVFQSIQHFHQLSVGEVQSRPKVPGATDTVEAVLIVLLHHYKFHKILPVQEQMMVAATGCELMKGPHVGRGCVCVTYNKHADFWTDDKDGTSIKAQSCLHKSSLNYYPTIITKGNAKGPIAEIPRSSDLMFALD